MTVIDPADFIVRPRSTKRVDADIALGRRDFLKYIDFGVTDATNGWMRAQVSEVQLGMELTTGWHYHETVGQFLFTLDGWVELMFRPGESLRRQAHEAMFIPGGVRHDELNVSAGFVGLEVTVPSEIGTIACDPPSDEELSVQENLAAGFRPCYPDDVREDRPIASADAIGHVREFGVGAATNGWMTACIYSFKAVVPEGFSWSEADRRTFVIGLGGRAKISLAGSEPQHLERLDAFFVDEHTPFVVSDVDGEFEILVVSVRSDVPKPIHLRPASEE